MMSADGPPVTEPRFINTHELVVSQDPDDCLCSCTPFYFFQFVSVYNLSRLICFFHTMCLQKK